MEIYIEYVLIENFLYDGALLWLAYRAAKIELRVWRLCLSAGLGAVFAVIFPLLHLPMSVGVVCKITVGCLLCLFPFERLRGRGQIGRYLWVTTLFFLFSFGFGGALLGIYGPLSMGEKIPSWLVFVGFFFLTAWGIWLIKRFYAKRRIQGRCYDCRLSIDQVSIASVGFYDSGNLATYQGIPVCFVSPALLYDLIGEKIWKDEGQVRDEMVIFTLAGKKKVELYNGKIEVKTGFESNVSEVYFAPSKNMIGREYAVLIHARILEGQAESYAID